MSFTRAAAMACLLASLATPGTRLRAQIAPDSGAPAAASTSDQPTDWLPADHWTRHALSLLAAGRLLPADVAALAWPARRADVRNLLASAASSRSAPPDTGALARRAAADQPTPERHGPETARAWLRRLDSEVRPHRIGPLHVTLAPATGYSTSSGRLIAGTTVPTATGPAYPGPLHVNDQADVFGEIGVAGWIGQGISAEATVAGTTGERAEWRRLTAGAGFGPVDIWLGRREVGFGPATNGFTLAGRSPLDGGGVDTPGGFRLPGFLAGLGRIRVNQVVARFDRSGPVEHPWLVATRVSFAPSERIAFGINRAALFGGEGNEPVTVGRLLLVAIGITDSRGKDSDFENQVASLDVVWTPVPRVLLWAEYGFDDAGTAFLLVPALRLGAWWTGPDWAPALSLGASITGMASSCCGHPAWYVHGALSDGWTDRGVPLGHSLGGNGLEASIDWGIDPVSSPVLARGRFFIRDRGSENLYAPDREGRTVGLEAHLHVPFGRLRVESKLEAEAGAGRDRSMLELRLVLAF